MNVKDVKILVEQIMVDSQEKDYEAAHSNEDSLYRSLLTAIACGSCEDPKKCAQEALKTQKFNFARWCA